MFLNDFVQRDAEHHQGVRRQPAGAGANSATCRQHQRDPDPARRVKTPILIGFTESITTVFWVAGAVALLATIVLLFPGRRSALPRGPGRRGGGGRRGAARGERAPRTRRPGLAGPVTRTARPVSRRRRTARMNGNGHGDSQASSGALPMPIPVAGAASTSRWARAGSRDRARARQDGSHVAACRADADRQQGRQVAGDRGTGRQLPCRRRARAPTCSCGRARPPAAGLQRGGRRRPATVDVTLTGSGELTGAVRAATSGAPLRDVTVTLTDGRGEVNGAFITPPTAPTPSSGSAPGHTPWSRAARLPPVRGDPDRARQRRAASRRRAGRRGADAPASRGPRATGSCRTRGSPCSTRTAMSRRSRGRTAKAGTWSATCRRARTPWWRAATRRRPARWSLTDGEADHDVRLSYDQALDELVDRHERPARTSARPRGCGGRERPCSR